ncbi:MAG: D-amino-acid transaminase [Paenibacillaceae bacterium]
MMMILYNDRFVSSEEIHVSILDRGYYYGDGIYEVFRIYNGILFEQEAHLARLTRSAEAVRISLPCSLEELVERLERLVALNGVNEGTLYMQITRGEGKRALPFLLDTTPVLIGYCTEVLRPLDSMRDGIAAMTIPDIRWLRCDIKSLNLLPNVLAKQEAVDHGFTEAILHRDGVVTECSASNIMIVKNGTLYTHSANHFILHGITREVVLKLADAEGIQIEQRPFTLDELYSADEAFICGTTVEITPIISIDNHPVGNQWDKLAIADSEGASAVAPVSQPGMITRTLQGAFNRYIGIS